MELRPFDILFYKGKGLISKAIEAETNSKYSHVALVLDEYHLVEIDWKYRLRINHITYRPKDFDVYRVKSGLTPGQEQALRNFIYSTLNARYAFAEILGFLTHRVVAKKKSKYICSTWINECFMEASIVLSNKQLASPQDLVSDCLELIT